MKKDTIERQLLEIVIALTLVAVIGVTMYKILN